MTFHSELNEGVKLSFSALVANKMRAFLTMLDIIIGIVSVTLMGAAIAGLADAFNKNVEVMGPDVLYLQKWSLFETQDWLKLRNRRDLKVAYVGRIANEATLLAAIAPVEANGGIIRFENRMADNVIVQGTTSDLAYVTSMTFSEGRFLSDEESKMGSPVAVLGSDLADKLFPDRPPVGQTIKVGRAPFRVIGVRSKQSSFLGMFSVDNDVIIPLRRFQSLFGTHFSPTIEVRATNQKELGDAREELRLIVRKIRGISPLKPDDFSIFQQDFLTKQFDRITASIGAAGLFITALALFVGGIGTMNIIFVSVAERTREIGIRRAVGATRRTILIQFMIESLLICLAGGIIGLIFSYPLTLLVARIGVPTSFSFSLAVAGILLSVTVGIIAGITPAVRASTLDPLDALRYE